MFQFFLNAYLRLIPVSDSLTHTSQKILKTLSFKLKKTVTDIETNIQVLNKNNPNLGLFKNNQLSSITN